MARLEKAHIVALVSELQTGGVRVGGQPRRPWKARTVNLMLFVLGAALDDAVKQGLVTRNVVRLVDRLPQQRHQMGTFTEAEVRSLLVAVAETPLEHAWHLALYGLRRGEVAGLRWRTSTGRPAR